MKAFSWRLAPFSIFVALVFFLWRGLFLEPQKLPSMYINKALPPFILPALGEKQVFNSQAIKGQVALLHVWASWCAACEQEQYFLLKIAKQAIPIYGLNYKDSSKNALNWLKEWGNPYQLIAEDNTGKVAIDLGVYGTPETFLIDKKGIIRYKQVGILDEKIWNKEFLPRILQLKEGDA